MLGTVDSYLLRVTDIDTAPTGPTLRTTANRKTLLRYVVWRMSRISAKATLIDRQALAIRQRSCSPSDGTLELVNDRKIKSRREGDEREIAGSERCGSVTMCELSDREAAFKR